MNKILISLVVSLIAISSIALAQPEIAPVTVTVGTVTDAPFVTTVEAPSTTLGGVTSKITNIDEKWLKIGSVKVWKTSTSTNVQTYKLYLVTATGIDYPVSPYTFTDTGLFQSSENVVINPATNPHVYETHTYSYMIGGNTFADRTKGVSSFESATLAIVPSGSYQMYAII
jgi:hypothetical protein